MKTLMYKLKHHNIPVEVKTRVYSQFYNKIKPDERFVTDFINHIVIKQDAISLTDRYLKMYGDRLEW